MPFRIDLQQVDARHPQFGGQPIEVADRNAVARRWPVMDVFDDVFVQRSVFAAVLIPVIMEVGDPIGERALRREAAWMAIPLEGQASFRLRVPNPEAQDHVR